MAEMSNAEIEQAVKAARYCARANPGGCSECGEDGRFCFGVMAPENGIPLVVLALASKLDATTAERDELKAKVADLESELKLNAKMLARQTDLARAAETPAAGAMPTRLDVMMAVAPSVPACYRRATSIEGIENTYWLTVDEWVQDVGQRADALIAAAQAGGAK